MKRFAAILAMFAMVLGLSACPAPQPGVDQATADVNQMISIALAVDSATQAIIAGNPPWLKPNVVAAINTFHTNLPGAIAAAKTALAAFESGASKDYVTALTDLAVLVGQIDGILASVGQTGTVAHARALTARP
jgi:hypothetical protein